MTNAIIAVTMPKWGIEMTEGTINAWTVREGQAVGKGETLLEVETEKIVNAVEAPASGTLRRIVAPEGEVRAVGSLIAVLADEAVSDAEVDTFVSSFQGATVSFEPDALAAGSAETAPGSSGGAQQVSAQPGRAANIHGAPFVSPNAVASQLVGPPEMQTAGAANDSEAGEVRISPIARRLAERLGVDLSKVQGTGRNGRISKEDVEAYAARAGADNSSAANGAAQASARGAQSSSNAPKRVRMSSMRATIARRLLESKQTIPHYRLTVDVDVSNLMQRRRVVGDQSGTKVSLNDMLVRACALALVQHPALNAQLEGDAILQFEHADIAIAVATENGLVTPIVRSADTQSLIDIARITADLADRARRSALTREEITGGTFTISNLGMYGLTRFDAIINPPQVAILAAGTAEERIVAKNGVPAVAQMMTLTLSADHRVVDGAAGAQFLATLKALLEQPGTL